MRIVVLIDINEEHQYQWQIDWTSELEFQGYITRIRQFLWENGEKPTNA